MSFYFPSRDRAEKNKRRTQKALKKALLEMSDLKTYLVSNQRCEEVAILREIEKVIERSSEVLHSIIINSEKMSSDRLYSNKEIQEKVSKILPKLPTAELEKFCQKEYSKSIFDLNFPLLLKVPAHFTLMDKRDAVKDHSGLNRWTWKYEYERDGFMYALSTQWYP